MKDFKFQDVYIALKEGYELMKNIPSLNQEEHDYMIKVINLCESVIRDFATKEYELEYLEIEKHNLTLLKQIEAIKSKMR